jgi:hypothetical protein
LGDGRKAKLNLLRNCPACRTKALPFLWLAWLNRATCQQCKARIGFHWGFAAAFYVGLVVFFIAALPVVVGLDFWGSVAVLFVGFYVLNFLAARFGPLEQKHRWWEP